MSLNVANKFILLKNLKNYHRTAKKNMLLLFFEYKDINGTLLKVSGFLTHFSTLEKFQHIYTDKYCKKIKRYILK